MDESKIQLFKADFPGERFPWYRSLSQAECVELRARVTIAIGASPDTEPMALMRMLDGRRRMVVEDVSDRESFDFVELLANLGVTPSQTVLINWFAFDVIDEMKLSDFGHRFGAIWWAGPDDIVLFDGSLDWFLIVDHHGQVGFLRPRR